MQNVSFSRIHFTWMRLQYIQLKFCPVFFLLFFLLHQRGLISVCQLHALKNVKVKKKNIFFFIYGKFVKHIQYSWPFLFKCPSILWDIKNLNCKFTSLFIDVSITDLICNCEFGNYSLRDFLFYLPVDWQRHYLSQKPEFPSVHERTKIIPFILKVE